MFLGLALFGGQPVQADMPQRVQDLVQRAVAHVHDVGRERAFADLSRSDGGFVDGELYVFCDTFEGVVVAHGGNPKLIGKNLSAVHDGEGRLPVAEIIRLGQASGEGWLEYLWPNPATLRVQRKVVYIRRVDEHTLCGSGYYRSLSESALPTAAPVERIPR